MSLLDRARDHEVHRPQLEVPAQRVAPDEESEPDTPVALVDIKVVFPHASSNFSLVLMVPPILSVFCKPK